MLGTEPTDLTEPVTGEQYMDILLARQAAWIARYDGNRSFPPLLEWFIRDGDEAFVVLPAAAPTPKRPRTPRLYRSAASLREERAQVQARLDVFNDDGPADRAMANLSPNSRSRAARNAGRRRFEQMDRDLQRYAALTERLNRLDGRIALADAREAKAATRDRPQH
ncbi:hypothetical protein [Amycolatopsis sp. NPDC059657]|uniref:hypothetical protein n=1 Tax=Amycolatopsis sp. NPDC059657 TaxID=3346899 RepID=UPI00367278FA